MPIPISGAEESPSRWSLSARSSLIVSLVLVGVGIFRFFTDSLHELNPDYWKTLDGTPLRYVVRAPTDGTIAGTLNAQWFKVLSVPAGISLIYLRNRFGSATAEHKAAEFRHWTVRGVWIAFFSWVHRTRTRKEVSTRRVQHPDAGGGGRLAKPLHSCAQRVSGVETGGAVSLWPSQLR